MTEALQPPPGAAAPPWRDPKLSVSERVADLLSRMTLEEKVQQIVGYWAAPAEPGEPVAPMQSEFGDGAPLVEAADGGLGELTRVFGTAPVRPAEGVARLVALQEQVAQANRFGIPAIAHEECLTGLTAYTATIFPCPLAWGASFDPALVEEMAGAIAESMRRIGVHQGLAPVLDVTRDYRWGRTEETIGEDPYLVAIIGTAYVRGLERSGVVATLKHFVGYSASRAGRNHAPAALGPRELADVLVEPFAAAVREGGARAVMHSYTDIDGIPAAADERLLTGVLRDGLGFSGVMVSDYYGISFLETSHGVADSPGEAAALALRAGVDLELPTRRCYGAPLLDRVREGHVPEEWVDRAASRVLSLKCELGLLDESWEKDLADLVASAHRLTDLDPPEHRRIARGLAEASVVLLADDGVLPLGSQMRRLAIVGPLADDPRGMLGCYSFPRHVGVQYPETAPGVEIPTLAEALRTELPGTAITVAPGCEVQGSADSANTEDMQAAVEAARAADVCVLAVGDRAGLFGRGTTGEGCDVETLSLPGAQAKLADMVLATGTPTVLVVLSGRPYALGKLAGRAAAVVQAFFPGEEGAGAVAGVISGRVEPTGRLPVSVPRQAGSQPSTYLHPRLGGPSAPSSVDPTPLYPFGHGLTWTRFVYTDLAITAVGRDTGGDAGDTSVSTDGSARIAVTVQNVGERPGTEVVQLYLADPVASVVRPLRQLAGFARVRLEAGRSARIEFEVHADRTSFTGPTLRRIVEPGRIDVAVGSSSVDLPVRGSFVLSGPERVLGPDRVLTVPVEILPLPV